MEPANRDACETAEDCSAQYAPNPACVAASDDGNTYCGVSFCAPNCDEAGSCDYVESDEFDFTATPLSGQCFCFPSPKGTQQPGEACAFGDINAEAGFCANGVACLGLDPARNPSPDACNDASDCSTADYFGNIECVEITEPAGKFCGSSFCSPKCDENDSCDFITDTPYNWVAGAVDDGQGGTVCYCLPQTPGTLTAGQACTMGEFNADAGNCAAGLSCVGSVDTESICSEAGDCNHGPSGDCGTYTPEGGTAADYCGFSFCSKACTEDTECSDFGDGACCFQDWCATADYCPAAE